ncbi:hypothetical protein LZF87_07255 [Flavobacterium enshiense]|nr:hypothetical protein LZF87_07255 [Flavobacterium enshiense]
MNIAFDNS